MPHGWTPVRLAPSHYEIQLQIGLKQGRFHELQRHLNEGESLAQLDGPPNATRLSG